MITNSHRSWHTQKLYFSIPESNQFCLGSSDNLSSAKLFKRIASQISVTNFPPNWIARQTRTGSVPLNFGNCSRSDLFSKTELSLVDGAWDGAGIGSGMLDSVGPISIPISCKVGASARHGFGIWQDCNCFTATLDVRPLFGWLPTHRLGNLWLHRSWQLYQVSKLKHGFCGTVRVLSNFRNGI